MIFVDLETVTREEYAAAAKANAEEFQSIVEGAALLTDRQLLHAIRSMAAACRKACDAWWRIRHERDHDGYETPECRRARHAYIEAHDRYRALSLAWQTRIQEG